jgi:hypothetical protein
MNNNKIMNYRKIKLLSVWINQTYSTYQQQTHTKQRYKRERSSKGTLGGQMTEEDTDGAQMKREY